MTFSNKYICEIWQELPQKKVSVISMIRISVCMIVKNEEKVLERCLNSLEGLYEELIIVDTGSSDRTKEIASRYTDKIYDYEWIYDFADARNYAFSKATGDYIYSADADEELDERNRQRFLDLKNQLLPEIDIVQMWYINTHKFATTENFEKEYRPKLYKRLRSFQWVDPIHESVRLEPVVFDSDIEILHKPESSHGKRDFTVFQKAIERGEKLSPKLHKMYARELMIAGEKEDFEKAEQYFLASLFSLSEELQMCSYVVLARWYRLSGNTNEFFKWCLKNIATKPCAEVCDELGCFYYDAGDLPEAMTWFQNAMTETEAILSAKAVNFIPYEMMADCYEKMAEEEELMKEYYLEQAAEYRKQILS